MKTLITFLVCGLAMAGSAQRSLKTFTSSDGLFRIQYADMLVNCAPHHPPTSPMESGGSQEDQPVTSLSDSCVSQGAICDGPRSGSVACFSMIPGGPGGRGVGTKRYKPQIPISGTDFQFVSPKNCGRAAIYGHIYGRVSVRVDEGFSPCNCSAIVQYKSIASASCCFSMYSPFVCAT
jgi:hypothetical protein